jgi:hypothetical protein
VNCQKLDWPRHKAACKEFEAERKGVMQDMGVDFIKHYDKFIQKNNELLCFFVFRALYGKIGTHVVFLDLDYHPEEVIKFSAVQSSVAVYSLEEMLEQNERNADISRNVTSNLSSLHTAAYTVGICIFEVGNIGRTPEGHKWARMNQFARESELSEASAHIPAISILDKLGCYSNDTVIAGGAAL